MSLDVLNLCRVCGYDCSPFFPWGEDGKTPSYSICPKCGVEWGYEDSSQEGLEKYRKKFLAKVAQIDAENGEIPPTGAN